MRSFPDWTVFTPEYVCDSLPKLLAKAEESICEIEKSSPVTFEDLVWKIDDATREPMHMWKMLSHIASVMNTAAWRETQERFQPDIVAFSLRIGQSAELYSAAKSLLEKGDFNGGNGPVRKRILEDMVKSAEHAGVALTGSAKDRFNEVNAEVAKLSMEFFNAVLDATSAFKYEKDGRSYTIDDANYPLTMKNCEDREVREVLYRARSTRAPENAPRVDKILDLKREQAQLLGFSNYAELSVDSKCAPSVDAVYAMYKELDEATVAIAERENAELEALAGELLGQGSRIEPWDVAFLAERLRERTYSYSEEELKKYFEFDEALKGLFTMADFLFGVEVVELTGEDKPSVWHPDVRFFAVKENGVVIAHFYLDPYVRNGLKRGGAWMNEFANRNDRLGVKPLSLIVLNLPQPEADGKCYLPFPQVETLFHEFGHAMQCVLTRIGEEDAAGINLVEWDAVEVASQFMENWCLDDRTGIVVPQDLKDKVVAAKNFRAANFCRRQLALGKTDFDLYSATTKVESNEVKKQVFSHFGMPMIEDDKFLCAFTHIFSGGYSAGYYSYKWSEVMSADAFGAFEDDGLNDDAAVQKNGRRLRETLYGLGGSKSAYDVFVDFRGRKPTAEALLRQQGLTGEK